MLSIFLFTCCITVYLLWRNVYLGLLLIFWLGFLFGGYWASWAVYKFWRLLINHIIWQYFLPYCGLSFHFVCGFLSCLPFCDCSFYFAGYRVIVLLVSAVSPLMDDVSLYRLPGRGDWFLITVGWSCILSLWQGGTMSRSAFSVKLWA